MPNWYEKRLLNYPEVRKEIAEQIEYPYDIVLEFDNTDGYFTNLMQNTELRGQAIILSRYDENEDVGDQITHELTGVISDYNILIDIAYITVSVQDPDPLHTELPKKVYEITDWAQSPPNDINPSGDLGKCYPIVFGHAKKVPLRYVHANYASDTYDYILCATGGLAIESNNSNKGTTVNVYRNKRLVDASEYTVYDGSQSSPYAGYAFIRFSKEQRDFSGSLYELHADVRGLKLYGDSTATRNFARVIQFLLSDNNLGLGLSVDINSFNIATGQLANLHCDGYLSEPRVAQDIINHLLGLCRGTLETNENGERKIIIETATNNIQATFGHGDGIYENIISIKANKKISKKDSTLRYTMAYRYNIWEDSYSQKLSRDVMSFGYEKTIETDFVRVHETADRILSFKQKREIYGNQVLELTVGMEGRFLKRWDLIRIIIPALQIDNLFRVEAIARNINYYELQLTSYSDEIYTYTAGSLPSDEQDDSLPDYTYTPPSAPTNLQKVSQGTNQGSDGTTYAFVELSAVAPAVNCNKVLFGYRKQGEGLPYTWVVGEVLSGLTWKGRIDGLVPGLSYQLAAVAENVYGLRSTVVTLNNQIAPGDTTAPATVTGLTGRGKYKTWEFDWTANTEKDLKGYRVQIGTSGFGTIYFDKIVDQNKVSYTDDAMGYGTLYCRVKAVDFTGNESASWSSTASATTQKTQTGDIGDSQVGTYQMIDNSVKYWLRQLVETQSWSGSLTPGSTRRETFYHYFGRKILPPLPEVSGTEVYDINVTMYENASSSFTLNLKNQGVNTANITVTVSYW